MSRATTTQRNKKLLDEVRDVMRLYHYSIHIERGYCDWIKRYIRYHEMRSRRDLIVGICQDTWKCLWTHYLPSNFCYLKTYSISIVQKYRVSMFFNCSIALGDRPKMPFCYDWLQIPSDCVAKTKTFSTQATSTSPSVLALSSSMKVIIFAACDYPG